MMVTNMPFPFPRLAVTCGIAALLMWPDTTKQDPLTTSSLQSARIIPSSLIFNGDCALTENRYVVEGLDTSGVYKRVDVCCDPLNNTECYRR